MKTSVKGKECFCGKLSFRAGNSTGLAPHTALFSKSSSQHIYANVPIHIYSMSVLNL